MDGDTLYFVAALAAHYAHLLGRPDDTDLRRLLPARLETVNDPRRDRYFRLLAVINGWPAPQSLAPVFNWPVQAVRARAERGLAGIAGVGADSFRIWSAGDRHRHPACGRDAVCSRARPPLLYGGRCRTRRSVPGPRTAPLDRAVEAFTGWALDALRADGWSVWNSCTGRTARPPSAWRTRAGTTSTRSCPRRRPRFLARVIRGVVR